MKRVFKYFFLFLLILLPLLYLLWENRSVLNSQQIKNNKEYKPLLADIRKEKNKLKKNKFNYAETEIKFVEVMSDKIFPYWYGTKWSFSGVTEMPNEGSIACGYFVTTTLRDAGYPINRVKLAQCASEEMIKNLVGEKYIKRFSNVKIEDFEKQLKQFGKGLYVVGLDNHTGFLLVSDKDNYFIHSGGAYPFQVVKEKILESSILIKSKYRVIGKVSSDKLFLQKWVNS